MAISKKIRFEVFKRDGFQCAYCGKSPPDVLLECDHINPKSKGGTDDINNLITACFDCNRGKSNISLDKAPQQLVDNTEILKKKEEQLAEYHKFIQKIERRRNKELEEIAQVYTEAFPNKELSTGFRRGTIRRFLEMLPSYEIVEAMYLACKKFGHNGYGEDRAIRYFCGICWTKIRKAKECQGDSQ